MLHVHERMIGNFSVQVAEHLNILKINIDVDKYRYEGLYLRMKKRT